MIKIRIINQINVTNLTQILFVFYMKNLLNCELNYISGHLLLVKVFAESVFDFFHYFVAVFGLDRIVRQVKQLLCQVSVYMIICKLCKKIFKIRTYLCSLIKFTCKM